MFYYVTRPRYCRFHSTPSQKVSSMSHAATRPTGHVFHVALAGLLGAVLVPFQVGAQVPGVPRRVRDAAARATGTQTQRCSTVVFDSVVVELTAARLDRAIKGMRASQDVLEGRRGGPSWNAMVTRRDAAANAAADLLNRKGAEMDAYRARGDRIAQCRDEAFGQKRQARRDANMQRAMSDPDFMRQTAELAQRVMEAQQRGDTAAVRRINQQVADLLEAPTREDTLAVDRHCGQLPPPPVSVVQLDSLRALGDSLNAQLQRRERQADSAAVAASGMSGRQLAMARERAEMFLAKMAAEGEHVLCGFSETELTILKARRPDLEELL
jgi:hypothetical protein